MEIGQGLVEYALLIVLIAIVVFAGVVLLGPAVSQLYVLASTLFP
jgi:Flp pilus assembly pilin Flp